MKIPWHKIASKAEWDKACARACVAARVEVPAALVAARAAAVKKGKK